MYNSFFRNSDVFIPTNRGCSCHSQNKPINDDNRFGGFLLPFITGAVISAPFWFVAGNNKNQYQNQPYPMYYPYQNYPQQPPTYYPYPPYR